MMEDRYEVLVSEPGPLYMRLEAAPKLRIKSWDPTPHGGPGPIEMIGRVRLGDYLVAIGETALADLDFQACVMLIKHAPRPCVFYFSRKNPQDNKVSDMEALRKSALEDGIPDASRAQVWRILLKYLPIKESEWPEKLANQRKLYSQFLQEFFALSDMNNGSENNDPTAAVDSELMSEIQKDIIRTQPTVEFFASLQHQAAMKRILFIYAKLNPGVRYVQGMNEVLAVLYYVFATSQHTIDKPEADAFFCFTNLMSELRDLYIHSLDHSDTGLLGHISKLNNLLQKCDPELWHHLYITNQLNPSHYALRWMTTLLTREFSLGQTLRLWDSLFASVSRTDFLCFFSLAMLRAQREALLQGDFTVCLSLLQNYPPSNPNTLLTLALALRADTIEPSSSRGAVAGGGALNTNSNSNNPLTSGSSWLLRKFMPTHNSLSSSTPPTTALLSPPKKTAGSYTTTGKSNFFLSALPSFPTLSSSSSATLPPSPTPPSTRS